jgi:hypothetical protein
MKCWCVLQGKASFKCEQITIQANNKVTLDDRKKQPSGYNRGLKVIVRAEPFIYPWRVSASAQIGISRRTKIQGVG